VTHFRKTGVAGQPDQLVDGLLGPML
jgi:hypothetical protein